MADFYIRSVAVLRRVALSLGLLVTLGLLSVQLHAASLPPSAPRLVASTRALDTTRPAQTALDLPPQLVLPNDVVVLAGTTFTLPVTLHPYAYAVAATAFSIDYDETWLTFDPTDGNNDGVPDAVRFRGPAAFSLSVMVDVNDTDGEIDFVIADLAPPIGKLPDGIVVELTLRAGHPALPVAAPVNFSTAPAISFGTPTGQSILAPLAAVDGIVHILSQPLATATATALPTLPTLAPSVTATPSATPSSTVSLTPSPTGSPTGSPTTTPTLTLTPTATATPLPTPPLALVLAALAPARGGTLLPNEVTITGSNFADGAVVTLGTAPTLTLSTLYISATYLRVTVPAHLTPGRYDVTVTNPNGDAATLLQAYQVVDPALNDDLFGQAATFWSEPGTVRAQSPVQLGLVVYRQGGRTPLANVAVHFYKGDPLVDGNLIGTGVIPLLSPRSMGSTTPITWTPPTVGDYTLFAVIDPDGAVAEADESNNRVQRSLSVLAAAPDTLAPHVDTFVVNSGAISTTVKAASLDTTASDPTLPPPSSGMGALFFIEYEYSSSAALWVPVQTSAWLPYTTAQHLAWQLMPGVGMKYLQAWAADQAGNISAFPAQALINYLPPTDRLLQDQVRIYRYPLRAGQPLHVRLLPVQGDPDLYIWPPDYTTRAPWVSNLAGAGVADEIALVAPVAGIYQVEVYGYSAAEYQLSITTEAVRAADGFGAHPTLVAADKPLLTQPVLALDDQPTHYQRLPVVPPQLLNAQIYLPLVNR